MEENKDGIQSEEGNEMPITKNNKIDYQDFISDLGAVFSDSMEKGLTKAFEKINEKTEESNQKIISELQTHYDEVLSVVKETFEISGKKTSEIIEFIKLIKKERDELASIRIASQKKFVALYYRFMTELKELCIEEAAKKHYEILRQELLNDYLKMEDAFQKNNANLLANHICLQIEDVFKFLFLFLGAEKVSQFVTKANIKIGVKDAKGKLLKEENGAFKVVEEKLYKQLFYWDEPKQLEKIRLNESLSERDYSLLDTKHKLIYYFFAYNGKESFFLKPDSRLRKEISTMRNTEVNTHRTINEQTEATQTHNFFKYLNVLHEFVTLLNVNLFREKLVLTLE